jgi:hypothetical protein
MGRVGVDSIVKDSFDSCKAEERLDVSHGSRTVIKLIEMVKCEKFSRQVIFNTFLSHKCSF